MGEVRFLSASRTFGITVGCLAFAVLVVSPRASADELLDVPVVWHEDDRRDIPKPEPRDPALLWEGPRESIIRPVSRKTKPSRILGHLSIPFGGDHVDGAVNVNALDEVLNSSWFTNRIGLFALTPEEVGRGPMTVSEPDRSAPWTVVSAKTQGVTPGFNIEDATGAVWVIKFDPTEYPNMASGAGVISNRLLWSVGYNVPEDVIVTFRREELALAKDVEIKGAEGKKRAMTDGDLDEILTSVTRREDGSYRAIASKYLPGEPLGPFDYEGRRNDDPNDRVPHEDRRELRGLQTIAAWISHFDTKQQNSLDVYVEEDGRRFVRHHLIDFASTLGTGARGPAERWGYEYVVDVMPILGRIFAFGLHEDDWRRLKRDPALGEIGTFDSEIFNPREFKPLQPNSAFANETARDAYWATKIISAFTDEHLLAAAQQAQYDDPAATIYMARVLGERRDKIARTWFGQMAPLEFFRVAGGEVSYRDLAVERGIFAADARYRSRVRAVDSHRDEASDGEWEHSDQTIVRLPSGDSPDPDAYPFWLIDVSVNRGDEWSEPTTVVVSRRGKRVIEIRRRRG